MRRVSQENALLLDKWHSWGRGGIINLQVPFIFSSNYHKRYGTGRDCTETYERGVDHRNNDGRAVPADGYIPSLWQLFKLIFVLLLRLLISSEKVPSQQYMVIKNKGIYPRKAWKVTVDVPVRIKRPHATIRQWVLDEKTVNKFRWGKHEHVR